MFTNLIMKCGDRPKIMLTSSNRQIWAVNQSPTMRKRDNLCCECRKAAVKKNHIMHEAPQKACDTVLDKEKKAVSTTTRWPVLQYFQLFQVMRQPGPGLNWTLGTEQAKACHDKMHISMT